MANLPDSIKLHLLNKQEMSDPELMYNFLRMLLKDIENMYEDIADVVNENE